jgi:hypothetical protein
MVELVDLAWGREIHLGTNLNEEPMEVNDVDDRSIASFLKPLNMPNNDQILQWSILGSFQL